MSGLGRRSSTRLKSLPDPVFTADIVPSAKGKVGRPRKNDHRLNLVFKSHTDTPRKRTASSSPPSGQTSRNSKRARGETSSKHIMATKKHLHSTPKGRGQLGTQKIDESISELYDELGLSEGDDSLGDSFSDHEITYTQKTPAPPPQEEGVTRQFMLDLIGGLNTNFNHKLKGVKQLMAASHKKLSGNMMSMEASQKKSLQETNA